MIAGQKSGTSTGNVYRPRVGSGRFGQIFMYLLSDTLQLHWDAHWAAFDLTSALGSNVHHKVTAAVFPSLKFYGIFDWLESTGSKCLKIFHSVFKRMSLLSKLKF